MYTSSIRQVQVSLLEQVQVSYRRVDSGHCQAVDRAWQDHQHMINYSFFTFKSDRLKSNIFSDLHPALLHPYAFVVMGMMIYWIRR